jgi:hypothetical protein
MMKETEDVVRMSLDFMPLKTNAYIVEGNALRPDWESVVCAVVLLSLYSLVLSDLRLRGIGFSTREFIPPKENFPNRPKTPDRDGLNYSVIIPCRTQQGFR